MPSESRIPLLVLLCLGVSSQAAPAQRQGQVLERPASQSRPADAGNAAQAIQTPVLGFVNSADRGELRAILGIPGASVFGGPMAVPAGVTSVHFAPSQNYALLAPSTGAFIGLMTFQGADEGVVSAICGAIPQPEIVAFSPSSSTAALYSKGEEELQVITGLPQSPVFARVIPRNDLPDEARFVAVADDGITLLEGTVHNAIYLLPQGGSPRFLQRAGDLEGMVFTPRSTDVVVFDREAGTAYLLQEVNTASTYFPVAEGLTGLGGNVFLQVTSGSAVIASTSSNNLWQIDLQSLQVQNIHLLGMPQMLQPLRTSGDYLLFYRTGFPAWILDSNGATGAVSLVPASTVARIHPKLIHLSTTGGLLGDANEQLDLANQPGFGLGCTDAREPPLGPTPPPRPTY